MKKSIILSLIGILLLPLVSWGPEGHSTVAEIADHHLSAHAKAAITTLLNHREMSSVSSWADDVRPARPLTAEWHFVNLQLGLNYTQFTQAVTHQSQKNIWTAILTIERELSSPSTPAPKKIEDLEFLIHFVGDAHQPMHVSRKEDHGGGWDTVTYKGSITNLHSVWDGQLIRDDNPNFRQLAAKIDHATSQQISQLQSDDILKWLYESYQISSRLYAESPNHSVMPANYYATHIPIVENRLEAAGIRLAGMLNKIFR